MSTSAALLSTSFESAERDTIEPGIAKQCQYPSLYQINTRAWIHDLSQRLGRQATLDDFPDHELERLRKEGFDWVWFLGVWQTGAAGRRISREHQEWQEEFRQVLRDFREEDVCGSCFAITDYSAHSEFGGSAALERLRHKVHKHGMRLLLDFVPNHTALDHPWVQKHSNFYVRATEEQLRREPQNYIRLETASGGCTVFAYGRDPYFSGWPDTLQLNYADPALQEAMRLELLNVASLCDGVRCDMAMLILPEVFERTWGLRAQPFWPKAILSVHSYKPEFLFMAEVYWDLEWTLQQQGFDYTYDKRLYDRLKEGHARPVRDHFRADMPFQRKSARFLENHDESRAAATFPPEVHKAAAILTFLCPGLRFFHDGQFEGRTKKLPVHLGRLPSEALDLAMREFYDHLLECLRQPAVRGGEWRLLDPSPAWDGNWTWDCFIGFAWERPGEFPLIAITNYGGNQSQCRLQMPFEEMRGRKIRLQDMMSLACYDRDGNEMLTRGLYLDMPAWGYHVFKVSTV